MHIKENSTQFVVSKYSFALDYYYIVFLSWKVRMGPIPGHE
jgi:hypothetical protein